jgi:hypothetical protein
MCLDFVQYIFSLMLSLQRKVGLAFGLCCALGTDFRMKCAATSTAAALLLETMNGKSIRRC